MTVTWSSANSSTGVTLSNGDLTAVLPNRDYTVKASLGKSTGKWYWEIKADSITTASMLIGIANSSASLTSFNHTSIGVRYYKNNAYKLPEGTAYGSSYISGDVIGVALDLDSGTLEFYKNGVSQGVSHTDILSMGEVFPTATGGSTTAGGTITANFGEAPFSYNIPSGYRSYDNSQPVVNKILLLSSEGKVESVEKGGEEKNMVLTSETLANGIVTSSLATYPAWQAFNSINTGTDSNARALLKGTSGWISYDFKKPVKLVKYILKPYASTTATPAGTSSQDPKSWTFEGSNDGGATWTVLDAQTNQTGWVDSNNGVSREYVVNSNSEYQLYKINISANNGNASYISIGELEIYYLNNPIIKQLPSHSEQNLIKYGIDSPVQLDGIFSNKNYILTDVEATSFENGKVFEHTLDLNKHKVKKITL